MVAVSQTVPIHVGSIPDAVRSCSRSTGWRSSEPGDLITCNDYYRVGTHLNDVVFVRPLIVDDQVLGALTLRCHQMDLGWRGPGRLLGDKTEPLRGRPGRAADEVVLPGRAGCRGGQGVHGQHPYGAADVQRDARDQRLV